MLAQTNTLNHGMKYESLPVKQPKKDGIRIISEMPSYKIVNFLTYRHRVGLLMLSNILLVSYVLYDKIGRLFF